MGKTDAKAATGAALKPSDPEATPAGAAASDAVPTEAMENAQTGGEVRPSVDTLNLLDALRFVEDTPAAEGASATKPTMLLPKQLMVDESTSAPAPTHVTKGPKADEAARISGLMNAMEAERMVKFEKEKTTHAQTAVDRAEEKAAGAQSAANDAAKKAQEAAVNADKAQRIADDEAFKAAAAKPKALEAQGAADMEWKAAFEAWESADAEVRNASDRKKAVDKMKQKALEACSERARDLIRDWASGSSMNLADLRRAWTGPGEFYPAASHAVLPVFEQLVKRVTESVRRQKETDKRLADEKKRTSGRGGAGGANGQRRPHARDRRFRPEVERSATLTAGRTTVEAAALSEMPSGTDAFLPPMENHALEQESLTPEKMAAIAVEFSNSSAVGHVAKVHAHLIANGICGTYTRNRCLFALAQACSLYAINSLPVRQRKNGADSALDVTVFHVGTLRGGQLTAAHIAGCAIQTLRALTPLLTVLPHPVSKALFDCQALHALGYFGVGATREETEETDASPFPRSIIADWTPHFDLPSLEDDPDFDQGNTDLAGDKLHQVQILYDNVLQMHRSYCGDLGAPNVVSEIDQGRMRGVAAALLDAPDVIDDFASRLVDLFVASGTGMEIDPPGWRKANATERPITLRVARAPSSGTAAHKMYRRLQPKIFHGTSGSTAAKHTPHFAALPDRVKAEFEGASEEFFLIFLLETDSDILVEALESRLCMRLRAALSDAAAAQNNAQFSKILGEVRTLSKFLGAVFHLKHWSFFKTMNKTNRRKLDRLVNKRYRVQSKRFTELFDVAAVLKDACTSGSPLAERATVVAVGVSLRLANQSAVARKTKWFADAVAAIKEASKDGDVTTQMLCEDILEAIGQGVGFQDAGFLTEDGGSQTNFVFDNLHFVVEHAPRLGELCEALHTASKMPRTSPGMMIAPEMYEPKEASIMDKLRAVGQIDLSPQELRIAEMAVAAGYKEPEKAGRAFELATRILLDPYRKGKDSEKFAVAAVVNEARKWTPAKKKRIEDGAPKEKASVRALLPGNQGDELTETLLVKHGVEMAVNVE